MLLGREREQAVIGALISSARSGRGGVVTLAGEPGIGKSALISYAETVAEGMNRLRARGVQSETHVPFGGLLELVRPALGFLDNIPAPQAEALAGALALRPSRGEDRFAIGAATLSLLAAYAEDRPLLILVDDAQWLDGSSAAALLFAARRLGDDAAALLVAVRSSEPSLFSESDMPRLELSGLDLEASTALLRSASAPGAEEQIPDSVAVRLHRETGGNPLALLELARRDGLNEETPLHEPLAALATVGKGYVERYSLLPEPTRWLLLLLAASDWDDLSRLSRPASALGLALDALDAAEEAGLIVLRGGHAEWHHPLVRSAVYSAAAAPNRRRAHRVLADTLPDVEEDRRAWHLALAAVGPDDATAAALEQAGTRARERSAYQEASLAFARAAGLSVDEKQGAWRRYAAADAAWLAGASDLAGKLLDDVSNQATEPALQVRIEQLRGHMAARRGHVQEGHVILSAAAEKAAGVDDPRAIVMLAEAVNACFYAGDPAGMLKIAEQIPAVASRCTDSRSEFFATMSEGMALVFSGTGGRGPVLLRHAMSLLQSADELRDDPRLLAWAAMGPLWLREVADWSNFVDRSLLIARERSVVGVLPFLLLHVAVFDASEGRWREAEAKFYEAIDLAAELGQDAERTSALARLAWLEARMGRFPTSREHASEALALSSSLGLGMGEIWALAALGEGELARGNAKAAAGHYERQQGMLSDRGIHDVDLSPAPEMVELYLRLGFADRALRFAREFSDDAVVKRQPWVMARAARTRGLVAEDGDFDGCFEEALEWHAATPDIFETARTHLAYGSRLRRCRQRVRARTQLRLAIEDFDSLGADPWSERGRAELSATGEHISPRGASSVSKLTPQELQIAMLLAQRLTTRETAAALFLSPKTVEYHLRSIYRRLGIASRDELVAVMAHR